MKRLLLSAAAAVIAVGGSGCGVIGEHDATQTRPAAVKREYGLPANCVVYASATMLDISLTDPDDGCDLGDITDAQLDGAIDKVCKYGVAATSGPNGSDVTDLTVFCARRDQIAKATDRGGSALR